MLLLKDSLGVVLRNSHVRTGIADHTGGTHVRTGIADHTGGT